MLAKCVLRIVLASAAAVALLFGQSITSGDITGTVTDPSDAVLTGVTVTLQASRTA
jgi:hypothetical protein